MSSSDESLSNAPWLFGAAGGLAFFPGGGGGAKSSCDADIVLADRVYHSKKKTFVSNLRINTRAGGKGVVDDDRPGGQGDEARMSSSARHILPPPPYYYLLKKTTQ